MGSLLVIKNANFSRNALSTLSNIYECVITKFRDGYLFNRNANNGIGSGNIQVGETPDEYVTNILPGNIIYQTPLSPNTSYDVKFATGGSDISILLIVDEDYICVANVLGLKTTAKQTVNYHTTINSNDYPSGRYMLIQMCRGEEQVDLSDTIKIKINK